MIFYAEATQRHFDVLALNMNPTVRGNVVDPFDVVGTETVEFSVFTHEMVCATALKSRILTMTI